MPNNNMNKSLSLSNEVQGRKEAEKTKEDESKREKGSITILESSEVAGIPPVEGAHHGAGFALFYNLVPILALWDFLESCWWREWIDGAPLPYTISGYAP